MKKILSNYLVEHLRLLHGSGTHWALLDGQSMASKTTKQGKRLINNIALFPVCYILWK